MNKFGSTKKRIKVEEGPLSQAHALICLKGNLWGVLFGVGLTRLILGLEQD